MLDVARSNSLTDLAARIKTEHEAVSVALKESVRHAMTAGDLLIEAKEQLKHGQWLPWLRDHCTISERTAQLYMRCAKNRAEIENKIRNDVADLTLSEAAAMLALSTDTRALLRFITELANTDDAEGVIKAAVAAGLPVIETPHPLSLVSDDELRDWLIYALWGVKDGYPLDGAMHHSEWLSRNGWKSPQQWFSDEGDRWRARIGMKPVSVETKTRWADFFEQYRDKPLREIEAALEVFAKKQERAERKGLAEQHRALQQATLATHRRRQKRNALRI